MTGFGLLILAWAVYCGLSNIADALRGAPYRRPPVTPGELRALRRTEP